MVLLSGLSTNKMIFGLTTRIAVHRPISTLCMPIPVIKLEITLFVENSGCFDAIDDTPSAADGHDVSPATLLMTTLTQSKLCSTSVSFK